MNDPRATAPLELARTMRKAITDREARISTAVEMYDSAVTEQERYEAGGELMYALDAADKAYAKSKREAVAQLEARETAG